jgi:hypothetical protein
LGLSRLVELVSSGSSFRVRLGKKGKVGGTTHLIAPAADDTLNPTTSARRFSIQEAVGNLMAIERVFKH